MTRTKVTLFRMGSCVFARSNKKTGASLPPFPIQFNRQERPVTYSSQRDRPRRTLQTITGIVVGDDGDSEQFPHGQRSDHSLVFVEESEEPGLRFSFDEDFHPIVVRPAGGGPIQNLPGDSPLSFPRQKLRKTSGRKSHGSSSGTGSGNRFPKAVRLNPAATDPDGNPRSP